MRPRKLDLLQIAWVAFSAAFPSAHAQIAMPDPLQRTTDSQQTAANQARGDGTFEETIDVLPELGLPVGGLDRLSSVIVKPKLESPMPGGLLDGLLTHGNLTTNQLVDEAVKQVDETVGGDGNAKLPVDWIIQNTTGTVDQVLKTIVPERH